MPAKKIMKTKNRIHNTLLKREGAEPHVLRELQSGTQEEFADVVVRVEGLRERQFNKLFKSLLAQSLGG